MKELKKPPKPRGGHREGSGRHAGGQNQSTIQKNMDLEALRSIVREKLRPMTEKQVANAMGIDHFFMRHPTTKQFEQVTDPAMIAAALNSGNRDSYYWIFTKDPSVQAFSDLLNRTYGKPVDRVELGNTDGEPLEVIVRKSW